METKQFEVRMGDARMKCRQCGAESFSDSVQRYLYFCIKGFQKDRSVPIIATIDKLPEVKAIIGLLEVFGVREVLAEEIKGEKTGIPMMRITIRR